MTVGAVGIASVSHHRVSQSEKINREIIPQSGKSRITLAEPRYDFRRPWKRCRKICITLRSVIKQAHFLVVSASSMVREIKFVAKFYTFPINIQMVQPFRCQPAVAVDDSASSGWSASVKAEISRWRNEPPCGGGTEGCVNLAAVVNIYWPSIPGSINTEVEYVYGS